MSHQDDGHPLVSVIMANYEGGRYIDRALQSILAQTMTDLEIIVCDDASSDDSVAKIVEMQRADARIRLIIADVNGGPAACRNLGLAAARGNWIAIVDSDDLMHPERFERLLAVASASGVDIVADDLLHFHQDGTPAHLLLPEEQQAPLSVTPEDWILAGSNGLPPLGYLKPMIRREALAALRYDETLRIGEDYDLMLRLLLRGATLRVVPEPWYFYRRHTQSVSHRHSAKDLEAMIESQQVLVATVGPLAGPIQTALDMRLTRLNASLSFERLVAALKAGSVFRAALSIARHPIILARLARSAVEHLRGRTPTAEQVGPTLVVLVDDGPGPASDDLTGALLIKVPPYQAPPQQTFGGLARRLVWRRIADLARGEPPRIVARGRAGAYAAGFIPDLGHSIGTIP